MKPFYSFFASAFFNPYFNPVKATLEVVEAHPNNAAVLQFACRALANLKSENFPDCATEDSRTILVRIAAL